MTWLQSLFFGLVSGLTEFLPVSSHAHQRLLIHIFGLQDYDAVRSVIVHAALLAVLLLSLREYSDHVHSGRVSKRTRRSSSQSAYDMHLVKNATVPMVIGICVFTYIFKKIDRLPIVVIFLIVNGVLLYLPERMMIGNKDARSMTFFDSVLIGLMGALSAFTGISRLGAMMLVSHARGADRSKALNWSFALSVPALIILIIIDFFGIATGGAIGSFWINLPGYLLSGIGAFFAGYLGIKLIKSFTARSGYGAFAYYSWGLALLTFLLYLAVV